MARANQAQFSGDALNQNDREALEWVITSGIVWIVGVAVLGVVLFSGGLSGDGGAENAGQPARSNQVEELTLASSAVSVWAVAWCVSALAVVWYGFVSAKFGSLTTMLTLFACVLLFGLIHFPTEEPMSRQAIFGIASLLFLGIEGVIWLQLGSPYTYWRQFWRWDQGMQQVVFSEERELSPGWWWFHAIFTAICWLFFVLYPFMPHS